MTRLGEGTVTERRLLRSLALLSLLFATGCQGVARQFTASAPPAQSLVRVLESNREFLNGEEFLGTSEFNRLQIPESGLRLDKAVLEGFGAGALHSYQGDSYHQFVIMVQQNGIRRYFPIGLVERHELGKLRLDRDAAVSLVRWEDVLGLTNGGDTDLSAVPLGGVFQASGMIGNSGTFTLNTNDPKLNELHDYVKQLAVLVNPDAQASAPANRRAPALSDVVIVTRVANGTIEQYFLPFFDSERYDDDAEAAYDNLQRSILQAGDQVEFTQLALQRGVIAGQIRDRLELVKQQQPAGHHYHGVLKKLFTAHHQ